MISISYYLGRVAGTSNDDFVCLGYRHDTDGDLPDDGESWVIRGTDQLWLLKGTKEWLTGIWRSPAGTIYVSSAAGGVYIDSEPDPNAATWAAHKLDYFVKGVWGLSDQFVLAWGARGKDPFVSRWNGASWQPMPTPPGDFWIMHGLAPDLVYGVGEGLIARWDGSRWHRVECPIESMLVSVFLVSPDEMYACSSEGRILEGSVYGWSHMLDYPGHSSEVAKWNGSLWLAAPNEGLHKFDGKTFVNVKPKIKAAFLCPGEQLVVSAADKITASADGQSFRGTPVSAFAAMLAGKPLLWTDPDVEFEEPDLS